MSKKLKTWEANVEDYNQFKAMCAKEGVSIGDKINLMIAEEIKVHGDGNPAFSLDQFMDNDKMKAVPAVFRTREEWDEYLQQCDPKTRQEILWQSQTITSLASKWNNHV